MPIPIRDINSLQHSTIVHLFELDLSALGVTVNPVLRFCNLTNGTSSVFWKGLEYPPFPIKAEGYEYNGKGSLPRPTVTVSNLLGVITNLVLDNDDLELYNKIIGLDEYEDVIVGNTNKLSLEISISTFLIMLLMFLFYIFK
jgi:phage-related protein